MNKRIFFLICLFFAKAAPASMKPNSVDITGLDKVQVLMALYDKARCLGLGCLQFTPEPLSQEEAEKIYANNERLYFDYVKGRVIKVDLSRNSFSTVSFNRDNGEGAAERAIENLRNRLAQQAQLHLPRTAHQEDLIKGLFENN